MRAFWLGAVLVMGVRDERATVPVHERDASRTVSVGAAQEAVIHEGLQNVALEEASLPRLRGRVRSVSAITKEEGVPEWQGLLLLGMGLCGGSGFCVYQASRVKRGALLARVTAISGEVADAL